MQYLLFDLDGTIIDSAEGVIKCLWYSFDHFGFKPEENADLTVFLGPPLEKMLGEYCNVDEEKALAMTAKFRERYKTKGLYENTLYPGITEALKRLHDSGKTLMLATSKMELYARKILETHGIDKYFDDISGAVPEKNISSKEAVISELLNRRGIKDMDDVIMIGDRKYDVEGAKAFGIDCLGVSYGYGTEEELTAAGAKYIAPTTEAMADMLLSL